MSQNTWHGRCPAPLLDQLPPSQIYERLYDVSRSLKIRAIISPQLFNLKPQIKSDRQLASVEIKFISFDLKESEYDYKMVKVFNLKSFIHQLLRLQVCLLLSSSTAILGTCLKIKLPYNLSLKSTVMSISPYAFF